MKTILVVTFILIFASVTILTTLAVWETTTIIPSIESVDHLHELSQLTHEQIRITKILDELNAKIKSCEAQAEIKKEATAIPAEIVIPEPHNPWGDVQVAMWDFVEDNHDKYLENIHRVKEFNPPFQVNYTRGIEEITFYFLGFLSKTHANLTIQEIYRIDVAAQNNFDYTQIGISYTIDAKVSAVKGSMAICNQCRAIISMSVPLYMGEMTTPPAVFNVGKVEARKYNPDVRVNFVSALFNVSSVLQRQSELMKAVYEIDKNIRWIVVEYENSEDPEAIADILSTLPFPTIHKKMEGKFNKVVGLNTAADLVENSDEIVFFLDVDMYFPKTFSQAIRSRTTQDHQVFYPVCYSFKENGSPPETKNGFYREGGLGNVGMYKSDYSKNKWFKRENDKGGATAWGNEDNNMFHLLVWNSYKIFRTYEPYFFHVYHQARSWKS